jgi:hypothetical protein
VDPFARLVGHHASAAGIAVELGIVALVAAVLGSVWWRGKRRIVDSRRHAAEMRDDDA